MDPNPNDDLVKQLLAVKRHEKPPEDYFENFLADFKERQRSEMLSQSARGLVVERVATWWWDGGSKWIYGAGAVTAAAVAMGVMLSPKPETDENAIFSENEAHADFQLTLPKIEAASSRPPAMAPAISHSRHNGFIPVSINSLQEL